MLTSILTRLGPLLHPTNRVRLHCLLLLVALVSALLYLGSRPYISVVFPYLPWDKLMHATAYGAFAALGWVAMGGRFQIGPVLLVGVIGLMDEAMQHYTPGRTADFRDIVADLIGGLVVVLVLKRLQAQYERLLLGRNGADGGHRAAGQGG